MKQTMIKAMLFALPLTLAVPAFAAPPEDEVAEPTEEEVLSDDILLIIDLPIAADEARTAGVEEAEISIALVAAEDAGVSAGDMTEVLDEESEQVKAKGKRKAFGQWVKMQVADGVHGKELAAKIKERKEELAELSDEEKAEIEAKIAELGEKHRKRRKKLHELREKARADGKDFELTGKDRHDKMMSNCDERHADAKAKWKAGHHDGSKNAAKQDKVDEQQDKLNDKQEAAEGDPEKLEKLEKLEDKLEKREDKLEKREDKIEKHQEAHDGPDGDDEGPKPGKPGKKGG